MAGGKLSHLDESGAARMVDISDKRVSKRRAVAESVVTMSQEAFDALSTGNLKKGDALATARIAGIAAAKRTADLIPLCHPIPIDGVKLHLELRPNTRSVRVSAEALTTWSTGIEMEAMTAVSVASLAIYDMVKGIDRSAEIESIRLMEKSGGKSGDFARNQSSGG